MDANLAFPFTNIAILIASFALSFLLCLFVVRKPRDDDDGIGYARLFGFSTIFSIIVAIAALTFHSMVFGIAFSLFYGVAAATLVRAHQ